MTVASTVPAEETGPVRPGAEGQSSAPAAGSQANAIPEGFPAKFVIDGKPDYAALARSYQELEGRFTQKNQQQQQPPQNTPAPEQKQEQANQEVAQGLANAGVNINDFQAEYARDGKLSDESYAKLVKAGYARQFVDDHIRGQEALFERQAKEIFDSVGGEKQFGVIKTWAQRNMPQAELQAFNRITETGTPEQIKLAVQGIHARYQSANGRDPKLIGGVPGGATGFASKAEVVAAMADPRYRKDDAYRASVMARMAAGSPFRGR